jgi:hypothetical protein
LDRQTRATAAAEKKRGIAEGTCQLLPTIIGSRVPPLRLAFNKLIQPSVPKEDRLRRMIMAIASNHERAEKKALCLWKILTMKQGMEAGIVVLRRRPNIVDGAMMLDRVNRRLPRHALRVLFKNNKYHDQLADAVKKLMLINRVDLQLFFAKWSGRHDIPSTVRKTKDMLSALNLNLRPLKWSFDALKTYEPDMLRKACRRLILLGRRKPRYWLWLWRTKTDKTGALDD